jgi:hypothetical protein
MNLRDSNPTPIWNDYWYLASERHPILSHQRVSQHLIANANHRMAAPMEDKEVVFRVLLLKVFNNSSAWDILNNSLESTKRKNN